MDKIIIKGAQFNCNVGISEKERKKKQKLVIDIEIITNFRKASSTDDIRATISYSDACLTVQKLLDKKQYRLIETAADAIASEILNKTKAKEVAVRVKKTEALKKYNAEYAAVEIRRK